MTTPEAPADPPPPGARRATRTPPSRHAPHRGFASAPAPGPEPERSPAPNEASTSEAIANAVRLGYDVIGQNIEQGREAAHRFRAGAYSASEAPQDLARLAARMLNLTRELSTTTFDVLERLIQDPNFAASVRQAQPAASPSGADAAGRPTPPEFYPGRPPSGARQEAAAPAPPPAPAPAPATLDLTCAFSGDRPAVMRVGTLSRPDQPAFLVVSALTAVDPALTPISDVTFSSAQTGDGVVAQIPIRQDQPAGLYSGVICAYDTQIALGMLTIEVLP